MLKELLLVILTAAAAGAQTDLATRQMAFFKNATKRPIGILTTAAGACITLKEATNTLNTQLLDNDFLVESYTHTVRKNIPSRPVHAHGSGAFGYFEVTHDISHICKAKLFSKIGKRTPVAARFSMTVSEFGASDFIRDPRGFSVKFYTEEGNFDLTAIHLPVFGIKEPVLFPSFTHALKRNPATNLIDTNMIWDVMTLKPAGFNEFIRLFSDYGTPYGYRHMEGFSIHTFQFYNKKGESSFGRLQWTPDAGVKHFNSTEFAAISAGDRDYYARDLYNAIASGNCPSWTLSIQYVPNEDVEKHQMDIFDISQSLPYDRYPLYPIGKLVLNQNPSNYFAEVESIAFCPGNMVPGILGAPDKTFQIRRFLYRDAQNYRTGCNFKKIGVNKPVRTAHTYNRDGAPPAEDNERDGPNYYPNTFNGPIPCEENKPALIKIRETPEVRNYKEAAHFYQHTLTPEQRTSLVENLRINICPCEKNIKQRVVQRLTIIHPELGKRLGKSLAAKCSF